MSGIRKHKLSLSLCGGAAICLFAVQWWWNRSDSAGPEKPAGVSGAGQEFISSGSHSTGDSHTDTGTVAASSAYARSENADIRIAKDLEVSPQISRESGTGEDGSSARMRSGGVSKAKSQANDAKGRPGDQASPITLFRDGNGGPSLNPSIANVTSTGSAKGNRSGGADGEKQGMIRRMGQDGKYRYFPADQLGEPEEVQLVSFVEYDDEGKEIARSSEQSLVSRYGEIANLSDRLNYLQRSVLDSTNLRQTSDGLLQIFREEVDNVAKEQILVIANNIPDPSVTESLFAEALEPSQPRSVRMQAAFLATSHRTSLLEQYKDDPDPSVRIQVIDALGMESSIRQEGDSIIVAPVTTQ